AGHTREEPGTGRAITSRRAAASRTVRLSTPSVVSPFQDGESGPVTTRPRLGLKPNTPQQEAGIRIEPPPSLPGASGSRRAATAAAAPPLDPPAFRSGSVGLRAGTEWSRSVLYLWP